VVDRAGVATAGFGFTLGVLLAAAGAAAGTGSAGRAAGGGAATAGRTGWGAFTATTGAGTTGTDTGAAVVGWVTGSVWTVAVARAARPPAMSAAVAMIMRPSTASGPM
jgi:hypothetical protein